MTLNLYKRLLKVRSAQFILIDPLIFILTPVLALEIRLETWSAFIAYLPSLWSVIFLFLLIKLVLLHAFGLYRCFWQYASIDELVTIGKFAVSVVVIETALLKVIDLIPWFNFEGLPRSLALLDGILSFLLIGGARFSVRIAERLRSRSRFPLSDRTLIVGAGAAGISLAQDMQRDPHWGRPVAFIDDDCNKQKLCIRGLPVLGDRHQIPEVARSLKVRKIIIAMPTAPTTVIRQVYDICHSTRIPTSILPKMQEILTEQSQVNRVREVQIEDLLGREAIKTDIQRVEMLLAGKRVLVTGAGGSIGSELCRQILRCSPAEIILLGKGENSIFQIQQELELMSHTLEHRGEFIKLPPRLSICICDIRNFARLEYVFEQYQPEIIFHAAAHKHVPMMQLNSPEAITTNVGGTQNLLSLAQQWNVVHFVMISTDKAVNPTNVMGASKRIAEMLVLQAAKTTGRPYVAVRFGNVLGSRGSVIPTFKQQIAKGGPVTVTHPDVSRYFMTIPEAVQLVLQAAVLGRGGEVFMLDMGQPIKIANLAKDLIRLSQQEQDQPIEIIYTGLRPGEKLVEELFIEGEQYAPTKHEKILMVRNASQVIVNKLGFGVDVLCNAAANNDVPLIHFMLKQLVEGYICDAKFQAINSHRPVVGSASGRSLNTLV